MLPARPLSVSTSVPRAVASEALAKVLMMEPRSLPLAVLTHPLFQLFCPSPVACLNLDAGPTSDARFTLNLS
jgi:hypothetical protein